MELATSQRQSFPEAIFRDMFRIPVGVAVEDPRAPVSGLLPGEAPLMRNAVESRQREYASGRRAARRAFAQIGIAPYAIPTGNDRAPVWPRDVTGSITHSDTLCVAVTARRDDAASIGIDVEPAIGLEDELISTICTVTERAWLSSRRPETRPLLAKLIFSAKEATFKCQFQVSHEMFDFHAVEITPDLDLGVFDATFAWDVAGFERGTRIDGQFRTDAGMIMSSAMLPPV